LKIDVVLAEIGGPFEDIGNGKPETFDRYREIKGFNFCIRCLSNITGTTHHNYCNTCWRYNKLEKWTRELNKETKDALND